VTSPGPTVPRTGPLTTGAGVLPGEQPPVEPEIAKQHTDDGAFAFAAYYLHALDWSLATTDAYLLRGLSLNSCTACETHIAGIDRLRHAGSSIHGGRTAIESEQVVTVPRGMRADFGFRVRVAQQVARVTDARGGVTDVQAAAKRTVALFVGWSQTSWLIVEIGS
jgi:hypothetical protein